MDSDLENACHIGDINAVKKFLSRDNIESKDSFGMNPLHSAVLYGKLDIVNYLIGEGAVVNAGDNNMWTPLHWACYKGHEECARALLQSGADLNALNRHKWTPLHFAISYDDNDANMISENKRRNIVQSLLQKGADPFTADKDGDNPLHIAVLYGRLEIVELLIPYYTTRASLDAKARENLTALHMAAWSTEAGRKRIIELLLEAGASVNVKDKSSETPLHIATECGHYAAVKLLIQQRPDDIQVKDDLGNTPLHMAAKENDIDFFTDLLKLGGDPTIKNKENQSAFDLALAKFGNEEMVRIFVKFGEEIYVRNCLENTPLHWMAKVGHINVITELLKLGADITWRNKDGKTALNVVNPSALPIILGISSSQTDSVIVPNSRWSSKSLFSGLGKPGRQKIQSECLHLNYAFLIKEIHMEHLCHNLVQHKVINEHQVGSILVLSKEQQLAKLMPALKFSNQEAWQGFLSSLEESDQGHIAWRLRVTECVYEVYQQIKPAQLENFFKSHLPTFGSIPGKAVGLLKFVTLHTDDPDITINFQTVDPDRVKDAQENPDDYYKMSAEPRGRAIILNNETFKGKADEREGSSIDVRNLERLFEKLGFKIQFWTDLSAEKIKAQVQQERKLPIHKEADAFILFAMSHGGEGSIYGTDNKPVSIEKDIINCFDGKNCPQLLGKPKLFFVQSCQGDQITVGVPQADSLSPCENPDVDATKQFIHEKADVLVVHSTVPGYKSWRDPYLGSWFVRDLIIKFVQYAHKRDLQYILTKVNQQLGMRQERLKGFKQISQIQSTLTKSLFFMPLSASGPLNTQNVRSKEDESPKSKYKRLEKYINRDGGNRDKYISKNLEGLVNYLKAKQLLVKLIARNVINVRQKEEIETRRTSHEKNDAMVQVIRKVSNDKYFDFLEILAESDEDLVESLTENQWAKPTGP